MGVTPNDNDYVVVGASIEDMLMRGFRPVGKSFPVFINKESKEEYALARKEIKLGPKHTDFGFVFDESITLEEDLVRRDFTCNALAYDPEKDEIIDYFTGKYPNTRSQSPYGTCWAHSAAALSEFYMINHELGDKDGVEVGKNIDQSELQLAYFCYHQDYYYNLLQD